MRKVPRFILVLVTGALAWGNAKVALAQSLPPGPGGPPPSATPVLGLGPIGGGQPIMPGNGTAEWTAPLAGQPCHEPYHEFCFPKGVGTVEFMTGSYFKANIGPQVPTFDWIPFSIRLGHIFDFPQCDGFFRGSVEALVELTAGSIYNGIGSFLVGPTAFLRYNFVQPDCRFIPYYQLGVGFVYNDAYHDQTQRAVGQAIEFYLQTQIGVKWFVRNNLSLNLEGGFIHISNCNTASRNLGINSFGGAIGVTYYFPLCWKQ